ncbi:MAG: GNAT family N-acetyltransferase [Tannerella sp.]|jgi:ElaA protein|nr:GNAT family N-acetyltransferase [Tannerella sp.]
MKKSIAWKVSTFGELSTDELYAILHLRGKVFVVEQNAPYLDPDYKDRMALHLHGYIDDELVAYCRLFKAGDYFEEASVGRVIIAGESRKYGYGHELMKKAIGVMTEVLHETAITISAQRHLKRFYETHSFCQIGEMYIEDTIPHIRMKRIK